MIEFEEKLLKGLSSFLNILVDNIRVLFFQLVSFIKKLDAKFGSFFIEQLKVLTTTEYSICTYLFLHTIWKMPRGL